MIARHLDLDPQSVRSRIEGGLRRLRKRLDELDRAAA